MPTEQVSRLLAIATLVASAIALLVAPTILPASYSWIRHTTSESGSQGVEGAWMARLGFVLFGVAVLLITRAATQWWGRVAGALHGVFGICMLSVAAFSTRSWIPNAPFDKTEDLLHSVAATVMGFAFAFGVAAVSVHRLRQGRSWRRIDLAAVVAATGLPLLMTQFPDHDGVLQRLMFAIAYLWYAETWVSTRVG